jgi:hypothetical protein
MKKSIVLSIVLLTSAIKAEAPVTQAQPATTTTAATAATAADLNKTQQALQAKIDALTKKVDQLIAAGQTKQDELAAALHELAATITASQKVSPAMHPCKAFSQGAKDASYATRLIADVALACAGCNAATLEEKLLFAFYPFFHHVVHNDAAALNDSATLKWVVSNWTTLGLVGTMYILGRALNWEAAKTLRATIAVIYAQGLTALALTQLDLNAETEQAA